MKKNNEKQIENAILTWLNLQSQCYAFKQDVRGIWDENNKFFRKANKWTPIGGSDILVCYRGRFIAIEVKTPAAYKKFFGSRGKHEMRQKMFLEHVDYCGGLGYVVCCLAQVEEMFLQWSQAPRSNY